MIELKDNYQDDVLDSEKNQLRKYNMIHNDDGTVSFVDATVYSQNGDNFGAKDVNDIVARIGEVSKAENIAYDGDKSVKGAIDECVRTLGYTKSYNLLPCNKVGGMWNGITTTPILNNDNSLAYYSVSGSRTSETYYNIYDSQNLSTVFPEGVEAGKTYKVSANSTNALIRIGIFELINGAYQLTVNTNTEAEWTPNANTTRLEIRILVDSTASGLNDVRIYPMIRPSHIKDDTYKPYVEDLKTLSVKSYITETQSYSIPTNDMVDALFILPSDVNEVLSVNCITDGTTFCLCNYRVINKTNIHVVIRNLWTGTSGLFIKLLVMYR